MNRQPPDEKLARPEKRCGKEVLYACHARTATLSVVSCQLSVVSCQLSVVSGQLQADFLASEVWSLLPRLAFQLTTDN
jgi:hypothetical protein